MTRIGFRRLLPLLFTAIHVALLSLAAPPATSFCGTQYDTPAYQESVRIPITPVGYLPLKPAQKFTIVLDLPAFILGTFFAAIFLPQNDGAILRASIPFVPLLWYCIGRWLDGILGYRQRLRLPRALRGLLSFPAAGLLCLSAAMLTPLYHHRTADTFWVGTGFILWSGLWLVIAFSSTGSEPARAGNA
jgi:hypothetical protein